MVNKYRQGYIYLIDGGNGLFKIGKTIRHPKDRLKDMQTMCPVQLELVYYFESKDLVNVERILHHNLKSFRRHGEWFELSDKQVEIFKGIEDYFLDTDFESFWGPVIRYRKAFESNFKE